MATQFIQNFKKVSDKSSPRFGQKRESVTVTFEDVPVSEIPESQIAIIIKDSLTNYAKRLFTENSSDWNYVPSVDQITVANLVADLTKPDNRGSRVFTVANIAAFVTVYKTISVQQLGKTDTQASNAGELLIGKLNAVLAKPKIIDGMEANLLAVAETAEWETAVAANPVIEEVLAKFIDIIEDTRKVAEELDEDSI